MFGLTRWTVPGETLECALDAELLELWQLGKFVLRQTGY